MPKDLKKMAKEARVPNEVKFSNKFASDTQKEIDANFEVMLNILHFFTKKVYVTAENEKEIDEKRNKTEEVFLFLGYL